MLYNNHMSKISFEEEDFTNSAEIGKSSSKMSQWLMDKGIAKSESVATIILIGVIVVSTALAIFIMKGDDIMESFQTAPVQTDQQF